MKTAFYASRVGQQKIHAQKYMKIWEREKTRIKCPPAKRARQILKLSNKQFARLLDISERQVNRLNKELEFTFAQKLLVNKAIEIFKSWIDG